MQARLAKVCTGLVKGCKTLQMVSVLISCCHTTTEMCLWMQIKRAIDPEAEAMRMAEMRRLQRQMKGIKLQYMATDDTVFFDDVAGIGEAKVSHLPKVVLTHWTVPDALGHCTSCCLLHSLGCVSLFLQY